MDEQERKAIALRRYAMIDDLVGVDLAYGEKSALLEELALAHGVSISYSQAVSQAVRGKRV